MAKKFELVSANISGVSVKSFQEMNTLFAGTRATSSVGETSLSKAYTYVLMNAFTDVKRNIRQADQSLREITWGALVCARIGIVSKKVSDCTVSLNSLVKQFVVTGEKDNVLMCVNLADFVPNYQELSNLEIGQALIDLSNSKGELIGWKYKDSVNAHQANQFDTIDRPRELFELVWLNEEETKLITDSGKMKAA